MHRPRRFFLAAVSCLSIACAAAPASAFFQDTSVEGVIGHDLGGIWLVVDDVSPEFRVMLDREKQGVPFKVGPMSEAVAPLVGKYVGGVEIKEITNEEVASAYGVFKGDLVTKINNTVVTDQKSYDAALEEGTQSLLFSIRRPQLKYSEVRLVKIKYEPQVEESEGQTSVGSEKIRLQILDGTLPFADKLEKLRQERKLWSPKPEDLKELSEHWYEYEAPEKPTFVKGSHRIVAESEFDSSLREDDNIKGSSFAIVSDLQANPLRGGGQQIGVYGVRDVSPDKIRGVYVQATLASAPFPISLEFKGLFTMYKIADYSDKDAVYRASKEKGEEKGSGEDVKLAPDIPEGM